MVRATVARRRTGARAAARPTPEEAQSLIDLLRSLQDGDAEEQRETLESLMQALDEDRMSARKLFARWRSSSPSPAASLAPVQRDPPERSASHSRRSSPNCTWS